MSFDKNHQSPDTIVNVHKRTTKVNLGVVAGVLLFIVAGVLAVWFTARNPPETPAQATGQQ